MGYVNTSPCFNPHRVIKSYNLVEILHPKCKRKASQIELDELEDKIKDISNAKIMIGIIPKGDREKGICIKDKGWADGWAKYYDLEIPHHRHRKKL